jgi:hypothetical protein
MKKFRYYLLSFFAVLFLMISCTEVIEININDSDPQIVVEAEMPESGFANIKITKSLNITATDSFPAYENAIVTIQDNMGNQEILKESSPGIYQSVLLKGVPGRIYSINIMKDDAGIFSKDSMPETVKMNGVLVTKSAFGGQSFGPNAGNQSDSLPLVDVTLLYNDPVNIVNYYRIVEYRNNKLASIYLDSDKFNNGKQVKKFLFSFDRRMAPGDTLAVEMQSISAEVFDYFYSFSGSGGGPSSGSPANPLTNLNGTRLGYFSAYGRHRIEVILTPEMLK